MTVKKTVEELLKDENMYDLSGGMAKNLSLKISKAASKISVAKKEEVVSFVPEDVIKKDINTNLDAD